MYPSQQLGATPPAFRHTLLIPSGCRNNPLARRTKIAEYTHRDLLHELQRFRAQSYLHDGAIHPSEISADGRHVQPADHQSWHLLTHNVSGELVACARYHALDNPSFPTTSAARTPLAESPDWRHQLPSAVESFIRSASSRRAHFAEVGGWCVAPQARHTTVALHSVLFMFALGEALGGTIGLCTATRRHASASILQRLGARPIPLPGGQSLPSYFDPRFNCEMELLVFDSLHPAPRYTAKINALRQEIETQVSILAPAVAVAPANPLTNLLHSLQTEGTAPFAWGPVGQEAGTR